MYLGKMDTPCPNQGLQADSPRLCIAFYGVCCVGVLRGILENPKLGTTFHLIPDGTPGSSVADWGSMNHQGSYFSFHVGRKC